MTEPVNKFNKAQDDRRKRFVAENDYVADDVVSMPDTTTTDEESVEDEGGLGALLNQKRTLKTRATIYLDADADDFYTRLSRLTSISKSKLMSEVLKIAINTDPDIKELANSNKKIKKVLDDFNKGFY